MKSKFTQIISKIGIKTRILFSLFLVLAIYLFVIQFESYKYPSQEEIDKRLNYLERVISEPLDDKSEILRLKKESYEFILFSYAYAAYAATNIAVKDSIYKERATRLIKESIYKVLDKAVYSSYEIEEDIVHLDSIPDYSVLYLGHLNLMIGCYRLLSDDSTFNSLNDKISKSLFDRYLDAKYLNLESYSSAIWIPDNSVAIASLKMHSYNTGGNYESMCKEWVEYVKLHYVDSGSGTLFSTINPSDGTPKEEPRGSMLGWAIMFIYQFDKEFAINLYNNYKENFSQDFLIFRLFKERYEDSDAYPDIDSGPIIFGYSIPANEFALGGAIIANDYKTAKKIERLISFGAEKEDTDDEIKYNVRFIDMNISPMAEALVLNSLTITRWADSE